MTKRSGAQPGNKNALKHGFYSKRFSEEEKERLNGQSATDVKSEIAFLRVCMDRLAQSMGMQLIEGAAEPAIDDTTTKSDEHYLKQLNTLSLMSQSLGTLIRTQHLIHGGKGEIEDAITNALEQIRLDMGI